MDSTSLQAPTVPPRPATQTVTPSPSNHQATSSTSSRRRITQSRTPPPRFSAPNTSHSTRQRLTPPPRSTSQNASSASRRRSTNDATPPSRSFSTSIPSSSEEISLPPVPARWDICTNHSGQKYTAVCMTCVKFLCNKCLLSEIYYHNQCSIAYLSDNAQHACHVLKQSVSEKMENMNKRLTNFQTSLCKKRDRMLKKKNETVSEIKHYYKRLRDLILSKLHSDEEELLNMMKERVADQDAVILETIQQCCATTGAIQDKNALIRNFEQSENARSVRNNLALLKELVSASNYLKECESVERDVTTVRDAFLVIRFFVNSDTEQTILNSNVACVEVLNSQSNNQDGGTLESERINEVAQLQAISSESITSSNEELIDNISDNDELRVAIPPLSEQTIVKAAEPLVNLNDSPVDSLPVSDASARESPCFLTDEISDLINEFDTRIINRPASHEENSGINELTNEMILSTIPTETALASERDCETVSENVNEPTPEITVEFIDNVDNINSESDIIPEDPESTGAYQEDAATSSRQSVEATESLNPTQEDQVIPVQDEDPPPPYPGQTSTPEPPGPDELPPPYPGTGPPPPYSQRPETQQPPRRRFYGESVRDRGRVSRNLSDSDFPTRHLEIESPTQASRPRLSRPKVSKVFSVNEANDRRVSGIFALASVHGNAFLVIDRWNKKLKYFGANGASFGGLIFREEPWDITDMSENIVAVTVPKLNTLYKIKVTESSIITTSTVSTLRSYACLAFNKVTQLFVCGQVPQFGEAVIDIIGIDGGQIIQTFRTGFTNELRFSYPRYVQVSEDGIAIVCDWNLRCLILFKLDGTVIGRYRGTIEFPLNEPTGIAYNHNTKEIYVIDAKHNSTLGAIHIVTLNCICKEIVRWDNEFRVARSITPHANGYALGNKSGVISIFANRQRR